jgi:nickel-dependent lactate racemase
LTTFLAIGNEQAELSAEELREGLFQALQQLGQRERVLAIPPDMSRFHSRAGELTRYAHEYYGEQLRAILPAVGTHAPMSFAQKSKMFGDLPPELFRVHHWRGDTITSGEVPASFIHEQSEGKLNYPWPVQVNRTVVGNEFDLVLSLGQVVPHEVIGMANYNKNILIGTGGPESINRSHYLAAVYGMERIMGRADTPVRRILNYASSHFLQDRPIVYVLTVVARNEAGRLVTRGLFIGNDEECFLKASQLSLKVNIILLDEPIRKAVVYLDPDEFHSTWLGNKAIYRTRMALADGAELIILAPGVKEFGEDAAIDKLIRKYGYAGTTASIAAVEKNADLAENLSAAAHLIHGSSEGRFKITYCPGKLSREEVSHAGYEYAELGSMLEKYDPRKLTGGFNVIGGEGIFFVPNPGLGLWAHRPRFDKTDGSERKEAPI